VCRHERRRRICEVEYHITAAVPLLYLPLLFHSQIGNHLLFDIILRNILCRLHLLGGERFGRWRRLSHSKTTWTARPAPRSSSRDILIHPKDLVSLPKQRVQCKCLHTSYTDQETELCDRTTAFQRLRPQRRGESFRECER
jgi:hypothetical protein